MFSILNITDGVTKINLLDQNRGFHLTDWLPTFPQAKDGGVFRSSPFVPGRAPVNRQLDNLYETYTVSLDALSQDDLIADWNSLIDMLEGAVDYWVSSANFTPVYLEAKGPCETNTRYAVIKFYSIPNLPNPYLPPFNSENGFYVTSDIPITLELGLWTAYPPGSSTCLPLAAQSDTYGSTKTCTDGIVLGNKHTYAQITHAYHFDASAATFSANLIGGAKPQALFPAVPAAGDILYVGVSTAAANPGPFSSIVFDISTAAVGIAAIAYEYWNGAAWTALAANTYTYEINVTFVVNTGIIGFYFLQPTDMESTAINGITAYWLRFRITGVAGGPTPPYQSTRDIYSAIYPHVTIDASDVPGSMDALAQYILRTRSSAGPGVLFPVVSEVIIAARSVARGASFTPFINLSDVQVPAGITKVLGANTTYQDDSVYAINGTGAPTGRFIRYAPGAATAAYASRVAISLATPLSGQYSGRYRAFLRFAVTSASSVDNDFSVKLIYGYTGRQSDECTTTALGFQMCSLGDIDISMDDNVGSDTLGTVGLSIWASHNTSNNSTLYLYDLILMPSDEMLIDSVDAYSANNPVSKSLTTYLLKMDSLENPKQTSRTRQYIRSSGYKVDTWRTIAPAGILAKYGYTHRLYFLQFSRPELVVSPTALVNPRYHIMRGVA